jgi:hypothetical protein
MTNHPITPPPELLQQWMTAFYGTHVAPSEAGTDLATRAAQWGADQELGACCRYISETYMCADPGYRLAQLRAARRPKPLSLKEQALNELDLTADSYGAVLSQTQVELIRRALEKLDD